MSKWQSVSLMEICSPKQWPTIPQSAFTEKGYPVYGANGRIGSYSEFNHEFPTILITCRGATCGTINVCEPMSYVTGNAMALDDLDARKAELRFVVHALVHHGVSKAITGTAQPQITRQSLASISIPLPPLSEQRRIADILDKADAIRRTRRETMSEAIVLTNAVFHGLFGDVSINDKNWPVVEFKQVLTEQGFRNGVSPSRAGGYPGKVLVLSAITGSQFDPTAIKDGTFASPAKAEQLVSASDFLICRGNGNLRLVGVGQFPRANINDTVFPDTIIAAPIDRSQIAPYYLQQVWRSGRVRSQIESGARTTNGTHKVNQRLLGSISFPLPPICEQLRFSSANERITVMLERLQSNEPEELFAVLTQRAFNGEL